MQTTYSMLADEPVVRSQRWRALRLGFGVALVVLSLVAVVCVFVAASSDSAAAWRWGGVAPAVFVGLVGIRRRLKLLVSAGVVFALLAASSGVGLLAGNHHDAWLLIVLAFMAVAEVSILAARRVRAVDRRRRAEDEIEAVAEKRERDRG